MQAQWLGSPNYTPGRGGQRVQIIVIHTMVGTIASANARFQQAAQQASAHYGVGLDGSLVQWVAEKDTAYHAGDWLINETSIGIEHEDNGDYNGVRSDALYSASSALVSDIAKLYGIALDRAHVRKHSEVSDSPTACPDALDINRIIKGAIGGSVLDEAKLDEMYNWIKEMWTAPDQTASGLIAKLQVIEKAVSGGAVLPQDTQDAIKAIASHLK